MTYLSPSAQAALADRTTNQRDMADRVWRAFYQARRKPGQDNEKSPLRDRSEVAA